MKTTKITYWISTVLFALVFATTSFLYLTHSQIITTKLQGLGYPLYVLDILGTAKILGVIALLVPRFPRLKEWAYAGFTFDLIGAFWSHSAVQGWEKAVPIVVPFTVGLISYLTYHRLCSHSLLNLSPSDRDGSRKSVRSAPITA